MSVHINASGVNAGAQEGDIDIATMKKFVSYCRLKCAPRLSESAATMLSSQVSFGVRSLLFLFFVFTDLYFATLLFLLSGPWQWRQRSLCWRLDTHAADPSFGGSVREDGGGAARKSVRSPDLHRVARCFRQFLSVFRKVSAVNVGDVRDCLPACLFGYDFAGSLDVKPSCPSDPSSSCPEYADRTIAPAGGLTLSIDSFALPYEPLH